MPGLKWVLLVAGVLVAAAFVVAGYGASRWAQATHALLARLEAARVAAPVRVFEAAELEDLPPPVQRYLRAVLKEGQPIVAAASVDEGRIGQSVDDDFILAIASVDRNGAGEGQWVKRRGREPAALRSHQHLSG